MDHNLDSLNAIGVDFIESDVPVEVSQGGLALPSSSNDEGIPMEFEQIEEKPLLMDTSEEIIDFMGDQFALQEYSVQDNQTTGLTTTAELNQNVLSSQVETMMDLQLQSPNAFMTEVPKVIAVKAAIPARSSTVTKKSENTIATASLPKQVAIAPKPPRLVAKTLAPGKKFNQFAPKPVALVKKVSLGNVVQANTKGNSAVLAQIGKQLVMVPAGAQKLKLVTAATGASTLQYSRPNTDQTSLIQNNEPKPKSVIMGKVIQQDLNTQPAVLTKILPTTSNKAPQTRYVTIGNKIQLQQIITLQSPAPKLVPTTQSGNATKKVVISSNPPQNVILKTTAPPKTAQIGKDGNVVMEGQQTQLHQINVPGKGIQYIRLVTNTNSAVKAKAAGSLLTMPSKFVLTDSGKAGGKKLVRIAPINSKTPVTQPARSSQSLLAPLSPAAEASSVPDITEMLGGEVSESAEEPRQRDVDEMDSKEALRALIEETVGDTQGMHVSMSEVEVEYKRPPSPKQQKQVFRQSESVEQAQQPSGREQMEASSTEEPQHSLIVIPSSVYDVGNKIIVPDEDDNDNDESQQSINMEAETSNTYQSPETSHSVSEPDTAGSDIGLGLRPRKPCNCTKSQCLKLYCDCFANGEFCNQCNCINCHNNLHNEELRQKAIRGCLERNPNAFRPKIGKSKTGGPEIIRRHNKGCNCKRSGCLKNYCECYEAKIACTAMCKCVGCRNVEESLERYRGQEAPARPPARTYVAHHASRAAPPVVHTKQPCSFMTSEVIEAVCQCLLAAGEAGGGEARGADREPLRDVIDEFARCLQDIIAAAHHAPAPATATATTHPSSPPAHAAALVRAPHDQETT